jgi:hypothetical protein
MSESVNHGLVDMLACKAAGMVVVVFVALSAAFSLTLSFPSVS